MKRSWFLLGLLACWGLAPAGAWAQEDHGSGIAAVFADTSRNVVWIGLAVIDVPSIDVREETFSMEGVLYLEWKDKTQAGREERGWVGQPVLDKLENEVWWPYPEFVNARGERGRGALALGIEEDGSVYYEERFSASLDFPLDLRKFPFDTQRLVLTIIPSLTDTSEVFFSEEAFIKVSPLFQPPEWDVRDARVTIMEEPVYGLDPEDGALIFSTAQFSLSIARRPGFYVWKIFIPLLLIITISWSVFWMEMPEMNLAQRLSVSLTSLLTIVAFNFVVGDFLPRISYLTFLDAFVILTYIMMALSILESVFVHQQVKHKRMRRVRRTDRLARWLFPAGYLGAVVVLALIYLL